MKRIVLTLFLAAAALQGYAQAPATHRLTIDWSQRDLDGKLLYHKIASGNIIEVSRQSFGEHVSRLEDWSLTDITPQKRIMRQLVELEGQKLEIAWDNFTKLDFYDDFPPERVDLVRWIVQDKVAFDNYAGMYLDSLQLNVPFYPDFFKNHQTDVEQYVNFNTRKLNLTWLGYAEMNGKNCKLVYYKSIYNPIDSDNDEMVMSGRSCFWGHIWIATDTRQIEYATMNEDLVYKFKLKANGFEQQINMQREVTYEKTE